MSEKAKSDSLSVKKDRENKIINNQLTKSQQYIIQLQSQQLDTSKNILKTSLSINRLQKENGRMQSRYSRQLIDAQKKIIEIQSNQTKSLIGDGSKPELLATLSGEVLTFFLTNNSEFPIPDIDIAPSNHAYLDITEMNRLVKINPKVVDPSHQPAEIHVGSLRKHAGYMFTKHVQFPVTKTTVYFENEIRWTYGSYYSEVAVKKLPNNLMVIVSVKYFYNNGNEFKFNNK